MFAILSLEEKDSKWSLNDLSTKLEIDYGTAVTKQSINERFNSKMVSFFKLVLERLINQFVLNDTTISTNLFNRILIKDSTCFQLPEHLATIYPGSGGNSSKAAIRVQFEYDVKSTQITDLSIHPFTAQDSQNAIHTTHLVKANDLIIRDLAYVNDTSLRGIETEGGYYLNRLPVSANIYDQGKGEDNRQYKKIDFRKLYKKMIETEVKSCSKEIYVGAKSKYKTRLIIELMPERVYAERIRKLKRHEVKKRTKTSKEKKDRMRFNLFITNIPEDKLPLSALPSIYRLRWQIELIFKSWKSFANLDQIKKMKKHRVQAVIYLRLIIVLLATNLTRAISIWYNKTENLTLSYMKTSKLMMNNRETLRQIALVKKGKRGDQIKSLLKTIKRNCKFEKKKGKLSSFEIINFIINCQIFSKIYIDK